ncbi:hypothetical protein CLOM_g9287 [Closterium sp. NIES-68]|nr:hypothetical protein CLOM_g9287 [Closterium sp. NIES-68]
MSNPATASAPGGAPGGAASSAMEESMQDIVRADGYLWLKYGQKNMHNSHSIRCYYKCYCSKNKPPCPAKKTVDYDRRLPISTSTTRINHTNRSHNHRAPLNCSSDTSSTGQGCSLNRSCGASTAQGCSLNRSCGAATAQGCSLNRSCGAATAQGCSLNRSCGAATAQGCSLDRSCGAATAQGCSLNRSCGAATAQGCSLNAADSSSWTPGAMGSTSNVSNISNFSGISNVCNVSNLCNVSSVSDITLALLLSSDGSRTESLAESGWLNPALCFALTGSGSNGRAASSASHASPGTYNSSQSNAVPAAVLAAASTAAPAGALASLPAPSLAAAPTAALPASPAAALAAVPAAALAAAPAAATSGTSPPPQSRGESTAPAGAPAVSSLLFSSSCETLTTEGGEFGQFLEQTGSPDETGPLDAGWPCAKRVRLTPTEEATSSAGCSPPSMGFFEAVPVDLEQLCGAEFCVPEPCSAPDLLVFPPGLASADALFQDLLEEAPWLEAGSASLGGSWVECGSLDDQESHRESFQLTRAASCMWGDGVAGEFLDGTVESAAEGSLSCISFSGHNGRHDSGPMMSRPGSRADFIRLF